MVSAEIQIVTEGIKTNSTQILLADPLDRIKNCPAVYQQALPQIGIYSNEYQWAQLLSGIKCNASDKFVEDKRDKSDADIYVGLYQNVLNFLPTKFLDSIKPNPKVSNGLKAQEYLNSDINSITDTGGKQKANVEFFNLNYSTAIFRNQFLGKLNMTKVRLNFAPHAYLYSQA